MNLGDVAHSNNWVIHGKHTATGRPLLSSDPHLGTSIPAIWQLMEVSFAEKSVIGASLPGIPFIGIGASNRISWGITAPLSDSADLWQETLNEDESQYFVDGEWRDLQVESEPIVVKGRTEPVDFKVRHTHRGPLFKYEMLKDAGTLFGGKIPKPKYDHWYSHRWGGMYDGNTFADFFLSVADGLGVQQIMDKLNREGDGGYRGVP